MVTKSLSPANFKVLMIGAATVASAFFVGIQTAGDIRPISLIEAGSGELRGDIDGNGVVDIHDAIAVLDIAQGYEDPSVEQLKADPNGDGLLTVDDALRILRAIAQ